MPHNAQQPLKTVPDVSLDDKVLPFQIEELDVRGRIIRLGPVVDKILKRHNWPQPVARLVAEGIALTGLLGAALKFEGRFQLQTKTDGIVDMLVVDFDAPDGLRATARFNKEALDAALAAGEDTAPAKLLGTGYLAFTIDYGTEMSRYQGIVPLEGQGLEAAAHTYFAQSEQIPTFVRLAVAEVYQNGTHHHRAGGLMIQFLPQSEERQRQKDLHAGDVPEGTAPAPFMEDDAWLEAKFLATTTEDHELTDPLLSSEDLLYRLFHQRGVRAFEKSHVVERCRCSETRIRGMISNFSKEERHDMKDERGRFVVTCEFCNETYDFDANEFE